MCLHFAVSIGVQMLVFEIVAVLFLNLVECVADLAPARCVERCFSRFFSLRSLLIFVVVTCWAILLCRFFFSRARKCLRRGRSFHC